MLSFRFEISTLRSCNQECDRSVDLTKIWLPCVQPLFSSRSRHDSSRDRETHKLRLPLSRLHEAVGYDLAVRPFRVEVSIPLSIFALRDQICSRVTDRRVIGKIIVRNVIDPFLSPKSDRLVSHPLAPCFLPVPGTIPAEIGKLTNLGSLYFDYTKISGTIWPRVRFVEVSIRYHICRSVIGKFLSPNSLTSSFPAPPLSLFTQARYQPRSGR